jgi:hypothetical protein
MRSGVSVALGLAHHVTAAAEPDHQKQRGREQTKADNRVDRHGESPSNGRDRLGLEVRFQRFLGFLASQNGDDPLLPGLVVAGNVAGEG